MAVAMPTKPVPVPGESGVIRASTGVHRGQRIWEGNPASHDQSLCSDDPCSSTRVRRIGASGEVREVERCGGCPGAPGLSFIYSAPGRDMGGGGFLGGKK